ncbi:hypothetical protein ACRRTK_005762 [Alexandromys fortis]
MLPFVHACCPLLQGAGVTPQFISQGVPSTSLLTLSRALPESCLPPFIEAHTVVIIGPKSLR